MRLSLYSDLHLELMRTPWVPPVLDVDVVILAGDIASKTYGLGWARETFRKRPNAPKVVYVAGNHEYYDAHLGLLNELKRPKWKEERDGVHFLEREALVLPGVRILGCTMWSSFDLYGPDKVDRALKDASNSIHDYWMIRAKGGRLAPRDTRKMHRLAASWLDSELAKPFGGKTVVVTHFAPHRRCVAPEHKGSPVTPYFVTDMSWLMAKYKIDVWCFGHTHTNCDFAAEGGCRVISNQRGYVSEARTLNEFRPELVLEV